MYKIPTREYIILSSLLMQFSIIIKLLLILHARVLLVVYRDDEGSLAT